MMNTLQTLRDHKRAVSLFCLISALCFSVFTLAQPSMSQKSTDAQPLMAVWQTSSKLSNPDRTPNLRIFEDGVFEVYRPIYMRDSGLFRGQLTDTQLGEVQKWMSEINQFDPLEAEEMYVRAEQQRQQSTGELYYSSETMITLYTLYNTGSDARVVVAENAALKASRFPRQYEWQLMADAEHQLMSLGDTMSLERIGDAINPDN